MSQTSPNHSVYDVVVVGARCAGAATAMLLARNGLEVLVVDRGHHGSDTLSTHALMRGAVLQLARWGILPALRGAGTPPVHRTTFHYDEECVSVPIEPRQGVDALYAPRRSLLDALLVDAAARVGAEIVHGTRVIDLIRASDQRVRGVVLRDEEGGTSRIRARLVIGADGLRSTVARLTLAERYHVGRHAGATIYGYWSGLPVDGYHWYFRTGRRSSSPQCRSTASMPKSGTT